MENQIRTIETLALVANPAQAEQVAASVDEAGLQSRQFWVDDSYSFAENLAKKSWDLVIITIDDKEQHIPSCILRYPDTPFVAMIQKNKSSLVDQLLDHGLTDVVSFSRPARLKHALNRALDEAALKRSFKRTCQRGQQDSDLLKHFLENSDQPIAFVHQGLHSYVNPAYLALTGLENSIAAAATPIIDLVSSRHQAVLKKSLKGLEESGSLNTQLEMHLQRQDQSIVKVKLDMSASHFEGESVVKIIAQPSQFQASLQIKAQRLQHLENSTTNVRSMAPLAAVTPLQAATKESPSQQRQNLHNHAAGQATAVLQTADVIPLLDAPQTRDMLIKKVNPGPAIERTALKAAEPEWSRQMAAILDGSSLRIATRPINSLRVDMYERFQLTLSLEAGKSSVQSVEKLVAEARRHQLLAGLDQWILYNAASELAKQLRIRPNTRFFVHLQASQKVLDETIPWLRVLVKQFSLPATSLNVLLDGGGLTDNARLSNATIRKLKNLNIGVGLCGLSSDAGLNTTSMHEFNDEKAGFELLEMLSVDFALLDPSINQQISDEGSLTGLEHFLQRCQEASITTMVEAGSPQSLSKLWKLGADCFIGDPAVNEFSNAHVERIEELDLTSAL